MWQILLQHVQHVSSWVYHIDAYMLGVTKTQQYVNDLFILMKGRFEFLLSIVKTCLSRAHHTQAYQELTGDFEANL